MVRVKKLEAISSTFSCAKQPERKYASCIAEISSHPLENSKEVAVAEKGMKEKSTGPLIDIVDDATNGLSMLAREVESDGTVVNVKGQRSNIFQSECKIQDKVCKLIINGGSFTNAISSDVMHALSLSTWRLPVPRYM